MADDDDDLDEMEVGEGSELDEDDEDLEPPGSGGKKKLLIIIGLALFLVVGGVAAAYFTGLLQPVIDMIAGTETPADGIEGEDGEGRPKTIIGEAVFHDLPEMLVNLNTGARKSTFLKIRVSLELENAEDVPRIETLMPRIVDNFQVYLRELRIEDLKGSAGMYRLREELLARVNAAVAPARVNDVLFKEMLVQ